MYLLVKPKVLINSKKQHSHSFFSRSTQSKTASILLTPIATFLLAQASSVNAEEILLEEITVTSQFRDIEMMDLPTSVSVFSEKDIEARGATNIDQLINMAPNVNYSSGASRGRFYQIRGIGERSQFVDPVSPSVGLIVDGIDFTGLGLSANTLDVGQIEILRGPQGTVYGANALAGLININGNAPSEEQTYSLSAELADYNSTILSAVASGPLNDKLAYRIAAQNQQSDGYIENDFLNRDDTNNIDETILKAKLRYEASSNLILDFTGFYLDADNGYDAFTFDNSRTTLSDEPGHDRQETLAASLKSVWSGSALFDIESVLSTANSDTEYGYDEDWTFVGFHPDEYSSTDNYERERDNISFDLRFLSKPEQNIFNGKTSWVAGAYLRNEDENLERNSTFGGNFSSDFETKNYASYGQLHTEINSNLALITGLRLERRKVDYADSAQVASNKSEKFWGGNVTLEYKTKNDTLIYGLVSRGYKGGGINGSIIFAAQTNPDISSDTFEFDEETMVNYELGIKGNLLENRLQMQMAVFYQDRNDVQAKQSNFNPADFSFDDYLTNADAGTSSGIEIMLDYFATDSMRLFVNLGWLEAEFKDFESSAHVDATDAPFDLDGRDLAHAPNYQYVIGTEISIAANWMLRLELEGKDEFYFSNSHDERSDAYELLNARLAYETENWQLALWGRNLTDEEVQTRGFYFSNFFGNNPANGYAPELYYQQGEPRIFGVSAKYRF